MKQTIVIDQLPPMLNEWQRYHHMKRHRIKQDWAWLIRAQKPSRHPGRVNISYTRVSTSCGDPDNVAASCKVVFDGLVKAGIIEDDSFKVIEKFSVQWEKAKSRSEQKTIIEVKDA